MNTPVQWIPVTRRTRGALIIMLCLHFLAYRQPVAAQLLEARTDDYRPASTVKVVLGVDEQNGTGTVIGADAAGIYVITARHVCYALDDEDHVRSLPLTILIADTTAKGYSKVPATMYREDRKLDMAVLKIARKDYPINYTSDLRSAFDVQRSAIPGTWNACGNSVTVFGLPGGEMLSPDFIEQKIINFNYFNQPQFLRMGAEKITGGHSGALVTNRQWEIVGMLLQVNAEGNSAKVLKQVYIDSFLAKNNISSIYLRPGFYVGKWQAVYLEHYADNMINVLPYKQHFTQGEMVTISRAGIITGVIEGSICVGDSVTVYSSTRVEMPSKSARVQDEETIFRDYLFLRHSGCYISQHRYEEGTLMPPKQDSRWLCIDNGSTKIYLKKASS